MWYDESILYHIYPLGFCGAPKENDGNTVNRLEKLADWIPHMKGLGTDCLYLGPVFDSDTHGYDTRDYRVVDCRLGDKSMLQSLCEALHQAGIRVILDGVFNHVGRGFWAFRDVREKRQASPYRDWFRIDFGRDSNYGDGFWYEGWEGHYELVKLNLQNPAVVEHLLECVGGWIDDYNIDGLRLDVAYSLDQNFMRQLKAFTRQCDPEFFLLGECLHGDYNQFVAPDLLDSCTNYECYKGLYSSFNELNFFEIGYSLNRQFGPEGWTLYKGKHLLTFVDNHDVTRIASILKEPRHLPLIYGLAYTMPGIPCLYYGSEWGEPGKKEQGDDALRPCLDRPRENALTAFLGQLGAMYRRTPALAYGDYRQLSLTNRQLVFRREHEGKAVVVAINADGAAHTAGIGASGSATNLLTGEKTVLGGSVTLPPFSFQCWGMGEWEVDLPLVEAAIPVAPKVESPPPKQAAPEAEKPVRNAYRLETERLLLRPWKASDLNDLVEGLSNLDVARWLPTVPHPYTNADGREFLAHCAAEQEDYEFAIELKAEGKVIGGVSLIQVDMKQGIAEGGIWLNPRYKGKGYGVEAFGRRIAFAFEELGLRKLENRFFIGNMASQRMQEHFGYRIEGLRRKGCLCLADGMIKDEYRTGLLREEWVR